ncbi:hypothetical protein FOZ60_005746 [Perkinsus olseni]|uniref:Uncharacterized protein n=1 Tax=Perkinsus olseni TaxID=32597 RepID=A0A7J6NQI0_PEROL|nr:hypothetical protein FOZ60_005746 [Perkinsus olseni]
MSQYSFGAAKTLGLNGLCELNYVVTFKETLHRTENSPAVPPALHANDVLAPIEPELAHIRLGEAKETWRDQELRAVVRTIADTGVLCKHLDLCRIMLCDEEGAVVGYEA